MTCAARYLLGEESGNYKPGIEVSLHDGTFHTAKAEEHSALRCKFSVQARVEKEHGAIGKTLSHFESAGRT